MRSVSLLKKHDSFDTDKVCHCVWILMTAGSATINMHEAFCHATSDQLLYRSKHKHSRNVDRVLKSFQTASFINQSSVVYNFYFWKQCLNLNVLKLNRIQIRSTCGKKLWGWAREERWTFWTWSWKVQTWIHSLNSEYFIVCFYFVYTEMKF